MPSKKGKIGDFPTYSHQITGSLKVGDTGASLSDLFGYSKEFEHQLQLDALPDDFMITSFLYESENDNAFIELMEQEMCMQEVDRDLLPPPMVIKITDRIKWSPELQRRFLRAIELLGGPEKATASSIFYLMNVKGLIVDHVKSHLQSYRQALEQESTKKSKLASTASVTLDSKGPRKAIRSASVALAPEGPSKPRTANKLIKGKEKAYDGTLEKKMLYEEEIQKHEEAQNRGLEFFMQFPGQQTIGNFEQVTGLGVIPTLSNDFPNVYTPYASYSAAGNYYLNPPVQGGSPDSNGFYPFPVGWL